MGCPVARGATTTSAADWRPRMSPPSPSAASSADSSRLARSPSPARKASIIASGTVGRSIMLACAETPSATRWPASRMQRAPV